MDRQDWLAWRRSGIGGSDAPVVAGVAPWGSRLELFLEKTGRIPEKPASSRMRLGLGLEDLIASIFTQRTRRSFIGEQETLRSDRHPFMLATLDRIDTDGEIVELKLVCPGYRKDTAEDGDSENMPDHWVIQGSHQAIVAGRDHVTFAALVLTNEDLLSIASYLAEGRSQDEIPRLLPDLDLRTYRVEMKPTLADALISLESEFMDIVRSGIAPSGDIRPQDAGLLASAYRGCEGTTILDGFDAEAADVYARLGPQIRELESTREAARASLLLSLGDCSEGSLPDGRAVIRKVIDVKESIRKASTQVRLFIKESRS